MRFPLRLLACLGFATVFLPGSEASGQKTDGLVLRNGNLITGEISTLDRGILSYKTDDAGTLRVEWDKVVSLTSVHTFEVELTTNRKLFGSLAEGPQPGTVEVNGEVLTLIDIVSITEISPSFVERTSGYLDLGWSLAKANRAHTLTFNAEARYRGEKLGSTLNFSFYEQGQEEADVTRSGTVILDANRFIRVVWAARFFASVSRDDALDLSLRTFLGAGARRRIVRTNRMNASWSAGFVGSRETYADEEESTYSTEFLAAADFSAFRLDSPELDLTLDIRTFTSLTESDRVRADFNARARYEIFADFYLALTLKSSFDSNPPSETALSKSSYTLGLSVGWSW
jgi:hypothetical protein